MSLEGVLAGVTVVSFEQAVAAPLATRHLADLGARVIKVERPHGDFARSYDRAVHGQASYFVWLNRGKQSIALDLTDGADLEVARRLVERADVVVQNLRPGALSRLGLDLDDACAVRPELVAVSISGYGPSGPDRDRKAYDLLVQADAGVLDITGTPQEQAKSGIPVADVAAGMYAFSAVLAALVRVRSGGRGDHVHIGMLDALAEWMTQPYYYEAHGHVPLRRTGARHATIAPYGPFRTADGEVFLAVQNDREWARLCTEVLGAAGLVDDPRFVHNTERIAHVDELTALIEGTLVGLPTESVRERLDAAGIANALVRCPADLSRHPQLVARSRWGTVRTPAGDVDGLRAAFLPDEGPALLGEVPSVGQHSQQIRDELRHPPT